MGSIAIRYFFVDEAGEIHRISQALANKIWDREEALPQFAGQRVRAVMLLGESEGSQFKNVRRRDCWIMQFGSDGLEDESFRFGSMRLKAEAAMHREKGTLDSPEGKLAQKMASALKWRITPEMEAQMLSLLEPKTKKKSARDRTLNVIRLEREGSSEG